MRRLPLRLAALVSAGGLGILLPVVAGSAAALPVAAPSGPASIAAAAADPATDPVERFTSCLLSTEGTDDGDLLMLFDQSGSIRAADVDDARITAAEYLVDQLVAAGDIHLQVSIAGFDSVYRTWADWTTLNRESADSVKSTLVQLGQDVNEHGQETDYANALAGARDTLMARRVAEPHRCQAIVWFSDGELDIVPRTGDGSDGLGEGTTKVYSGDLQITDDAAAATAEDLARTEMCRPAGIADQLRSQDIEMFAIGLESGSSGDFGLMRAVADGTSAVAGSGPCGAINTPTPGVFTPVADLDGLLFAFNALTDPDLSGNPLGICTAGPCPEFRHTFVLDNSVTQVRVLGTSDLTDTQVYLTPPDGSPAVALSDVTEGTHTVQVGSTTVDYEWASTRTVSMAMTRPGDGAGWAGQWAATFVNPGAGASDQSQTAVNISADLTPALVSADPLYAAGTSEFTFGINGVGGPIDPLSIESDLALTAQLRPNSGPEVDVGPAGLTKDQLATPQTADLSAVLIPGAAVLDLTLAVTTKGTTGADGALIPGTRLNDRLLQVPVEVLAAQPAPAPDPDSTTPAPPPPPVYPSVASDVSFGEFEGAGPVTANLGVTGSGCVWLPDGADVVLVGAPAAVEPVALSAAAATAQTCRRIDDATTGLPLTLTTGATGSGTLAGSFTVMIAPVDGSAAPVPVTVSLSASMTKPLNTTNFVVALIVALILGPGIPLLMLYVVKWATARFPTASLSAMVIPISVANGAVLRDGSPFERRAGDLRELIRPDRGRRSLVIDGVTLRTRTGRSPALPGFVEATMPGTVGAGQDRPASVGRRMAARLPLAVHNRWAVFTDPAGPADAAFVLVMVSGDASTTSAGVVIDDMTARLPEVLTGLRDRATAAGLIATATDTDSGTDSGAWNAAAAGATDSASPFADASAGEWTAAAAPASVGTERSAAGPAVTIANRADAPGDGWSSSSGSTWSDSSARSGWSDASGISSSWSDASGSSSGWPEDAGTRPETAPPEDSRPDPQPRSSAPPRAPFTFDDDGGDWR